MAVAACEQGLLQLNQISAEFHQSVGVHPYEGVAFNLEERSRIQAALACMNQDQQDLFNNDYGYDKVGNVVNIDNSAGITSNISVNTFCWLENDKAH